MSDKITKGVADVALGAPSFGSAAAPFSFNLGAGAAAGNGGDDDDDDDDDDGFEIEGAPLPIEVLRRVLGLKELHEQRELQLKDYAVERAALEKKYRELASPLFSQRCEVIAGRVEPVLSEAHLQMVTDMPPPEETESAEPLVGIPDFWLSALGRHEAFEHFLEEADVEALKFLVDVRVVDADDLGGFTIHFEFAENSFFANSVLTKTYTIPNLADSNGQPELVKIDGCEIAWKTPNDCLVQSEVKKRQKSKRGKNAGQTRVVTKLEPKPSFFHFFEAVKLPGVDEEENDEENDDGDEDEDNELREKIDNDVELAFALRNEIVPNAVLWFTGEACDDDDDDDSEGDEEDDDEEDD
ncbi:nucleosome assembly protein-domain-containing protein [Pelagophyceae sp. CCMP2097]|nr:nucleosome assembly protein-domain-containing protein [Pelagophyceae sp. CCMP2097]|mmetsp:Transcript_28964/g.100022  ORF Transcript_28964/g.100022 Transcript_28964/m.100022 type:complete len:355 (-) Transcript_28964:183-1247(-)